MRNLSLSYLLPSVLETEAFITVRLCNIVPTSNAGTLTPYKIFTKEKLKIQVYAFGTLAVARHPRSEDKSIRAEIGIFISHGHNLTYLIFWIPTRHQMYFMKSMIPLRNQVTPISWNYPQNIRDILPIQLAPAERPAPNPTVVFQSQTNSNNLDPRPVQEARPIHIINKNAKNIPTIPPISQGIPHS